MIFCRGQPAALSARQRHAILSEWLQRVAVNFLLQKLGSSFGKDVRKKSPSVRSSHTEGLSKPDDGYPP